MIKYVVTAVLNNGDAWETVRHTKTGLTDLISNILKDEDVAKFSVDEVQV